MSGDSAAIAARDKAQAQQAQRGQRRTRPPKVTETAEHRVIAAYFRKIGLGGNAVAFHIKNDQSTRWQRLNAAKMGILPGVPDWCIIDGGRAGFIELKPRGFRAGKLITGKLNLHEIRQFETHGLLKRAGAWVAICETLDEVLDELRVHGVPLRTEDRVNEAMRASLAALAAAEA